MTDAAVEAADDPVKKQPNEEKDDSNIAIKPDDASTTDHNANGTASEAEPKKDESPAKPKDRLQTSNWSELRDQDNAKDGGRSSNRDRDRSRRGGRDHYRRGSDKRGDDRREGRGGGNPDGHRSRAKEFRERQRDYAHNVKTDLTSLPTTDDPRQIRKQVEFYFSDSNLPQDNFLLHQVGGSENLPVPVSVITNFKRMRRFQPYSAVVAALRESEWLDIVGKEGEEEIQRKKPLAEHFTANTMRNRWTLEDTTLPRTVYAKGFDDEGPTTQFDIEAFFAPYGPTNAIRLRRDEERVFKKSVFVEFGTEAGAKQFLEMEAKPKWQGRDLLIMSKHDYVSMKRKETAKKGKDHKGHRDRDRERKRRRSSASEDEKSKEQVPEPEEDMGDVEVNETDTPSKKRAAPDGGHEEDGGEETKKAKQDVEE